MAMQEEHIMDIALDGENYCSAFKVSTTSRLVTLTTKIFSIPLIKHS
jgi:hypothetical protein